MKRLLIALVLLGFGADEADARCRGGGGRLFSRWRNRGASSGAIYGGGGCGGAAYGGYGGCGQ